MPIAQLQSVTKLYGAVAALNRVDFSLEAGELVALLGPNGAEIAARLNLSEGTVRNYLSEAISKLGAGNRTEAARIARQKGWL